MTADSPQTTCRWILFPMLAAFLGERLYNHLVDPEAAVFVVGYHVHHLFFGIMLEIPAALLLSFGVGGQAWRRAAMAAVGAGTGLILDEFIAMIATDMSTPAYLGRVSLGGAVVLIAVFSAYLLTLKALARRGTRP